MATLTGSTIATTYDRLLALPSGGLSGTSLVAITDGNTDTACALQVATGKVLVKPTSSTAATFEVEESDGTALLSIDATAGTTKGVIINEDGQTDIDFRVESINSAHAIFVDSSLGKVAINRGTHNATVLATLHINSNSGDNTTTLNAGADDLCLECATGNCGMTIYSGAVNDDKGLIYFANDTGVTEGNIIFTHNSTAADRKLQFGFSVSPKLTLLGSGHVGIGTNSPNAILHVNNETATAWGNGQPPTVGIQATSPVISMYDDNAGGTADVWSMHAHDGKWQLAYSDYSDGTDDWDYSGKVSMLTCDETGLGVGTATPISIFEIEDGLTTGGAILTLGTKEPTVVANDVLGRINFYAPLEASGTDAIAVAASIVAVAQDTFAADNNSTQLEFQTGKSEVATTKMTIDEDGNVGIGTTAFSSGVRALGILNGTDPGGATANTACFFAASGEMNYTDAAGAAATLDSLASDERMKDNITVIPDALTRLKELKGITFNYVSYEDSSLSFKDKIADDVKFNSHNLYGNNTRVGVIAQDVEKAYDGLNITNAVHSLPIESMVQGDMEDHVPEIYGDIKKLRVNTLIPLLIEAVKELSAKVEALESA